MGVDWEIGRFGGFGGFGGGEEEWQSLFCSFFFFFWFEIVFCCGNR